MNNKMGHATRAVLPLSFFVGFSEVVVWFFHVLLLGIWEHETLDQRFHSASHKQEIHQVESMCKIVIIPFFATFTGRKFAEPWVVQSCLNICCTFGVVLITSTSCNPTYLFWQFNVQNSIAKMASPICGGAKISPGLGLDHCFVCWCHQTSPLPEVSNEWLKARNANCGCKVPVKCEMFSVSAPAITPPLGGSKMLIQYTL